MQTLLNIISNIASFLASLFKWLLQRRRETEFERAVARQEKEYDAFNREVEDAIDSGDPARIGMVLEHLRRMRATTRVASQSRGS